MILSVSKCSSTDRGGSGNLKLPFEMLWLADIGVDLVMPSEIVGTLVLYYCTNDLTY